MLSFLKDGCADLIRYQPVRMLAYREQGGLLL